MRRNSTEAPRELDADNNLCDAFPGGSCIFDDENIASAADERVTAVGVQLRLIKFRSLDPVLQQFSAKIGVFLYWQLVDWTPDEKSTAAFFESGFTDPRDHRCAQKEEIMKMLKASKPHFIVDNLVQNLGSDTDHHDLDYKIRRVVLPAGEAGRDGGRPRDACFAYHFIAISGVFATAFEEPGFPYTEPNELCLKLKMRDSRYRFARLEDVGGRKRSFVTEECAKDAPAWRISGLPFHKDDDKTGDKKWRTFEELADDVGAPEECDPARRGGLPHGAPGTAAHEERRRHGPFMEERVSDATKVGFKSWFDGAFKCQRVTTFFVVNFIWPSTMLCVLGYATFLVPDSNADLRIELGTTLLLTLMAMKLAMSTDLPKTGTVTFLDMKLLVSFFYVFVCTMVNVLVPAPNDASSYRDEGADPLLILGRIVGPEDDEDPTLLWPRLLGGMLAAQESYFFYRMVLWSDVYATLRDRWCISCVRRQRQKQQRAGGTPSPASPPAGGGGGSSSRSPVARGATGAALFDIGGSTAGTIRGSAAAAAAAAASSPAATTAVANTATPTVLAANNEQANPIV